MNFRKITKKTDPETSNIQSEKHNILDMASVFRNGNETTIDLIKSGVLSDTSSRTPGVTISQIASIHDGRKRNTNMEEIIIKDVLSKLRSESKSEFERYGLRFKRMDGVWIQDTVKILGSFKAKEGTVVMGNVVLENVTLSSFSPVFGNAFDKNHNAPYINLSGKIYY